MVEWTGYGHWKVAHGKAIMMAYMLSQLEVILVVAFKNLDWVWGGVFLNSLQKSFVKIFIIEIIMIVKVPRFLI